MPSLPRLPPELELSRAGYLRCGAGVRSSSSRRSHSVANTPVPLLQPTKTPQADLGQFGPVLDRPWDKTARAPRVHAAVLGISRPSKHLHVKGLSR